MSSDSEEPFTPADNENDDYFITQFKFREISLTWVIEDFDFVCNTLKVFESPKFPSLISKEEVKWYFRFEPVELKADNEQKFKITLTNTSRIRKHIKGKFYFLTSDGKRVIFICNSSVFRDSYVWTKTGSDFYKSLECDKKGVKTVKLFCKFQVLNSIKDNIQKPLVCTSKTDNLLDQLEHSFNDQTLKDVTFKVRNQEFKAHKVILSIRSPVFAAMFNSKMTEELTSVVEIEDMNPIIFQKMLRFIYTDKVEDLEKSAMDLYYLAEKYQLQKLKSICVNSLYKHLSLVTMFKTVEFAEMFSLLDLKRRCLRIMGCNLKKIAKTSTFEELLKNYPHFASEIFEAQNAICNEVVNEEHSTNTVYEFKQ